MKQASLQNVRQLRLAHLLIMGFSLAFALTGLFVVKGLEEHWLFILVYAAVLAVPTFLLHQVACARLLRPALLVFDPMKPARSAPELHSVKKAMQAIDRFALREALLSVILWALAVGGLAFALDARRGLDTWQMWILGVVGISTGLVDALLGFPVNQSSLARLRGRVEAMLARDEQVKAGSGRLSTKMAGSFVTLLLVSMGMGSLIWLSQAQQRQAEAVLADHEAVFLRLVSGLDKVLKAKPSLNLPEALREVDATSRVAKRLLVVDEEGKLQIKAQSLDVNPMWLRRIVEANVQSWRELRTPFLFLSHRFPERRHVLIWVGPTSLLSLAIHGVGGRAFWGLLLVLAVCVGLAWSLVRSYLQPLRDLSHRYRQLARQGPRAEPFSVGDQEIFVLSKSLDKYIDSVKHALGTTGADLSRLHSQHSGLQERISKLRDTSEHRSEVAEQTATSVTEMRSSIQSISEQMESLREATNDCSSAMFEIDQSVREVASSAENLQKRVDDTASSMTEMTVSVDEVSGHVDELARAADDTVASIGVIEGSIKQVENSTAQTHRLSEEVSEFANRGAESVRQTIAGITEIQQVTAEAQEIINRLGNQMEAVGKILTVIGDVAEKTNLLALNAAIIAAAAGEHGKGFAVVADEIKDLADRTATSTKEIANLIRSVQNESRRAIDAMQRGTGSVKRGVDLANNAGEALHQILTSVEQVTQMANDIATTTTENSSITRNITRSMANVASMVRQIKRAVKEQSTTGDRIAKVSEQMRDDAKFVFRCANEQVQAASGVSKNMGRISEMVSFVSKAMVEQSSGVDHVARVAEEVRGTFEQERIRMAELEEMMDQIGRQTNQSHSRVDDAGYSGEGES